MSTTTDPIPNEGAGEPASTHKPFIPDATTMPEFTFSAVLLGSSLGIIFAASSLYLVLKVGMTVSASIPVSVLAITLFRAVSKTFKMRQATILENNIVQTSGSAGESIAFGVGVTMPALLILGFDMDVQRVMVVSILGGLLGILAMIPLRRAFIVRMHGKPGEPGTLLYPEGTACAQVLISGEQGGTSGKTVFIGFGIAFLHKFVTEGMSLLVSTFKLPLSFINKKATFAGEMASELLGVGYIIGFRTSAIMMAGAILGYLVIIPIIAFAGATAAMPVPPGKKLISEMSVKELRDDYLLYIGAGCVAAAGIISMIRTLPLLVKTVRSSLGGTSGGPGETGPLRRTENDMSMRVVLFGSLGLVGLLAVFLTASVPPTYAIAAAIMVVVFGFLFVTVSARLTGEIGSSSNPISGMTVATLTMTCLIFLALGWTSSRERVLALSIAAVVCVAASNGGTTAQSLKTGFLVGGTPKLMQYAILVGAITSALVIGITLLAFNKAGTIYSQKSDNLPSIRLTAAEMAMVSERETFKGTTYLVWDSRRDYGFFGTEGKRTEIEKTRLKQLENVKEGRYLIDLETGEPKWLVDSAIMGRLDETDDGQKVKRDFDAPKTQVMGIIINGVLQQKLKWDLILIGTLIAILLELCGVSALAFAVGVYVPIQFSTPIFIGGILRLVIDRYMASQTPPVDEAADAEAKARAEVEAIRKSETSPGVLLAAGYIAGGSLAGMLIAFFNFSDELPKKLSAWQYSSVELTETKPFKDIAESIGREKLGLGSGELSPSQQAQLDAYVEQLEELNEGALMNWAPVKKGTKILLPNNKIYVAEEDTHLGAIAKDQLGDEDKVSRLMKQNKKALVAEVPLKKGTVLLMPDYSRFTVENEKGILLGEFAKEQLGGSERAQDIFDKNSKELKLPEMTKEGVARLHLAETLPKGTSINLPQHTWPALFWFGLLIAFLILVGSEKILKSPEEKNTNAAN